VGNTLFDLLANRSNLRKRVKLGVPAHREPSTPHRRWLAVSVQLVWFKRDLRLHDHAPLVAAARAGPVVGVYVFEPSVVTAPDFDAQHLAYIAGALRELRARLERRGGVLLVRVGECPDALARVCEEVGAVALWAHEETGNAITYARDRRVRAWAKARGLPFRESPHGGVVRRLVTRDGWADHWASTMRAPVANPPARFAPLPWTVHHDIPAPDLGAVPPASALGVVSAAHRLTCIIAGEYAAHHTLQSFLTERGTDYRRAMASPLTAFDACSRLSPHLAFGTISGRHAWQAARRRYHAVSSDPAVDPRWRGAMQAFVARLAWRDHFMQKLESAPQIEYENFSRAYDTLRPDTADPERLAAWIEGRTGYPFVDACMRALRAHGWINFRMRAMLVSFASYHLWLPWQATAQALAPHFLDYEPGIHYSQFQMQSGTTGINTARIYNPIKQGHTQDPTGVFIREWVPELEDVPSDYLHSPHEMPALVADMAGVRLGVRYPLPIVDHATAYREAKARLFAVRTSAAARSEAAVVYEQHGSRREPLHARRR
jgi:deoxyribodipyrimidine photo-lyase